MFQQALDGEFYNLDHAVKILKENVYKITFEVPIRLGKHKEHTYIQKYFKNINIPKEFKKIDDNLYINFNKILKITYFNDYCYLTSNTKKRIGSKYINYNIKVSGQEKINKIKKFILKGENMWIKYLNTYYNLDNVTNVFLDYKNLRIIFNFINAATNKNNIEDIKPEYEVENFVTEESLKKFKEKILENKKWIDIGNKLINLNNVYNIKILPMPTKKIIFINFVSNVTKVRNGEKIISTEFVKFETDSEKEFNNVLKKLQFKVEE